MKNKKINKTLRQTKGKTGFSLIELIVVVTIIAVLTVVGVVSYSGTSKKARDSRRVADLEKIALALELYRQNVGGSYPTTLTPLTTSTPPYLQAIPIGPKGESYTYLRTSNYVYSVCASVENSGSTSTVTTNCPVTSGVYVGSYRITNP